MTMKSVRRSRGVYGQISEPTRVVKFRGDIRYYIQHREVLASEFYKHLQYTFRAIALDCKTNGKPGLQDICRG